MSISEILLSVLVWIAIFSGITVFAGAATVLMIKLTSYIYGKIR